MFADDTSFMARNHKDAQVIISGFVQICSGIWTENYLKKTQVMT